MGTHCLAHHWRVQRTGGTVGPPGLLTHRRPLPTTAITRTVFSDYHFRYFRLPLPLFPIIRTDVRFRRLVDGLEHEVPRQRRDEVEQKPRLQVLQPESTPKRASSTGCAATNAADNAQATRSRRADTLRSPDTPASVDAARHGISAGHCECGVCTRWPVGSIVATLPVRLLSRRCTLHTCATLPWRQSGRCGRPAPSSLRTPRRVLADHIGNTPPNAPCSAGIS